MSTENEKIRIVDLDSGDSSVSMTDTNNVLMVDSNSTGSKKLSLFAILEKIIAYIKSRPSRVLPDSNPNQVLSTDENNNVVWKEPTAQVNADWDSTQGVSQILHKPDLSVYATTDALDTARTTLSNSINEEASDRMADVNSLRSDLTSESSARSEADANINSSLMDEINARTSGDTALQSALETKANASELTVTPGIGADADKTTIQLKTGVSATVITAHQAIPEQKQSDWNEADSSKLNFIKNKPTKLSSFTNDLGFITDSSIEGKADKSEMSITAVADTATIQLKSGTSATVLTQHQDISDKANKSEIDGSLGTLKEEFANFIWADYESGNDTNDGLTPQSPVKTLEKAAALAAVNNRKIHTLNPSGNSTYFEIHYDVSNDIRLESFGSVYFYRYDGGHKLNGSLEVTVKGADTSDSISVEGFSEITGKSVKLVAKTGSVKLGNTPSDAILGNKEVLLSSKSGIYAYVYIPETSENSVVTIESEEDVNIYSNVLNVAKINISGRSLSVGSSSQTNAPYTATNGFEIYGTGDVSIYGSLATDKTIKIRSDKIVNIYGTINGKAADERSYGYPSDGTLDVESGSYIFINNGSALKIANIKLSNLTNNIIFSSIQVLAQTANIKSQGEIYLGEASWLVQKSLVARAETGNLSFSRGGICCDHIKGYAGDSLLIKGAGLYPGYYKYAENPDDRVLGTNHGYSYCILEGARDVTNSDNGIRYISKTENEKTERKRFWKVSLNGSHIGINASIYGEHVSLYEAVDSYGQVEFNQYGDIHASYAKLSANHIRYQSGSHIWVGNNPNETFNSDFDNGDSSYLKCNLLTKKDSSPLVYMYRKSQYGNRSEQDFHFDVGMVDVSEIAASGGGYFAWVDQVDNTSGIPFIGNISGRIGGFINENSSNKFRPYPHDYKFIGNNFIVDGLINTGTISLHVDPYIGPMDLYWDPDFGHDNADGLSKSTAVKTPAGIDKALNALGHSTVLVLHVLSGSSGDMLGSIFSNDPQDNHDNYRFIDMNQVFTNNGIYTLEIRSEISPVTLSLKNWWKPSGMMTWITGFKALALDMTSVPQGSKNLGSLFAETEDLIHMWAESPDSTHPLRFDKLCLSAKSGTVKTEYLGAGSFIIHDSQNAYAKQPYLTNGTSTLSTKLSIDAKEKTTLEVIGYYHSSEEYAAGDISLKGNTVAYRIEDLNNFSGFVSIYADEYATVSQSLMWSMTMDVYAGYSATLQLNGDVTGMSGSVNCRAGHSIEVNNTSTNHTNIRLDAPIINFNGASIYGEPYTGNDQYTETKIKAATINAGNLLLYGGDFYIDCTELCGYLYVGGAGPKLHLQPETTLYANIEKISSTSMGLITIIPPIVSTSEVVKAFIDVKEIEGYTVPSSDTWRTIPWLSSGSMLNQKTFGRVCVYANVQKSGSSINDHYSIEHYAEGSEWKVNYLDRSNPSAIQTSLAGNENTKLLRLGEYNTFEASNTADKLYVCVPDPKLSKSSSIQSSNLQEAAFEFTIPEGSSLTAESIKFYSVSTDDYVYVSIAKGSEFSFTPGESDVPMAVSGLEALSGPGDTVVGVVVNHRVICTVFHKATK